MKSDFIKKLQQTAKEVRAEGSSKTLEERIALEDKFIKMVVGCYATDFDGGLLLSLSIEILWNADMFSKQLILQAR